MEHNTNKITIMRLHIEEALAYAALKGKKILKKDLYPKLYPDANEQTAQVNFSNLLSGRTERIKIEWVVIICQECGVSPNFLFGYGK